MHSTIYYRTQHQEFNPETEQWETITHSPQLVATRGSDPIPEEASVVYENGELRRDALLSEDDLPLVTSMLKYLQEPPCEN